MGDGTHSLKRGDISVPLVVDPIDVKDIEIRFAEAEVPFGVEKDVRVTRQRLGLVCQVHAPDLGAHLHDVGLITEKLLSDEQFKAVFIELMKLKYGKERSQEAQNIFEPQMSERIVLGLQLHDIGKLKQEIYALTLKRGRPTDEEEYEIKRHTAVLDILEALGIQDAVVKLIAILHHAPYYFGADLSSDLIRELIYEVVPGLEEGTLPLIATLAKLIDIFHAMNEHRPYRNRKMMLWWESAVDELPDDHKIKTRFPIERELKNKTPEDSNGALVVLFLKSMQRLWPDIEPQLTADRLESFITPVLPTNFFSKAS